MAEMRLTAGGNTSVRTFFSDNKQYRLTLSELEGPVTMISTPVDLMGTVEKMSGTKSEVIWSRKFSGRRVQWIGDFDVALSDDGQFFVLLSLGGRNIAIHPREKGPWEFASSADVSRVQIPKSIFETRGAFGASPEYLAPRFAQDSYFRSWPEILFRLDKLEGENVVAFWWRDENLWEACRVSDGKKLVFQKHLQDRWNAETRREIIEVLERARSANALAKVKGLPRAVAMIATNFVPAVKTGEIRETQYEFLTLLRNPSDRIWLEALFEPKTEKERRRFYHDSYFQPRRETAGYCDSVDTERVLGDWFLAVWDGKIKKKQQTLRKLDNPEVGPLYYLGKVEGTIHLSTPFHPRPGVPTGPVRLKLLPTDNSDKRREIAEYLGAYIFRGPAGARPTPPPPVMQIQFSFATVLPGKYQLKVIWDKRRPFTDDQKPGPGDYESALSNPFEVLAGQTISNLISWCTNRATLPGAENYYAADELKARLSD